MLYLRPLVSNLNRKPSDYHDHANIFIPSRLKMVPGQKLELEAKFL